MNNKIVYLFGAGASAGALPVVSDMKYRLTEFWVYFMSVYKGEINNQFKIVHEEIQKHKSPDTFARICYLKNDGLLEYLKVYLSVYFAFEQLDKSSTHYFHQRGYSDNTLVGKFHTIVDYRYISFISTITQLNRKQLQLPQNVNFISWNYDSQFEIAYSGLSNTKSLFDIRTEIGILDVMNSNFDDYIRYVKINGSADFYKDSSYDIAVELLQSDISRLSQLGGFFAGKRNEYSNLHFAWEHNDLVKSARKKAEVMIADANILVIIGYSFPDFNRYIDKQIFNSAKPDIIYVQDREPQKIIEKLDGVKKGLREKAQPISDTDQFLIPVEFWE